jgi:hypothetical protein
VKAIRIGVTAALLATGAHAQTADEKNCILQAASKLPSVPGLAILASRISPGRPGQVKPPDKAFTVELDVRAAGIDATMEAYCVAGSNMVLAHPPRLTR